MQQIIQVKAKNLQWLFGQDQRSDRYVAVCPALGLAMEGSSHRELMENISDSLHLLLNSLFKEGELERFLHEQGWTAYMQDIKDESEIFLGSVSLSGLIDSKREKIIAQNGGKR